MDPIEALDNMGERCPHCGGSGRIWTDAGCAEVLVIFRAKAGLTAKDVAGRLGLSPQYLADLEHGRRHWSRALVLRYVEALGQ